MPNVVSHTQIPDLATQVAFAKSYKERGFDVIATALSWNDSTAFAKELKEKGVEAEAVALDPLTKKKDLFERDTFVLWNDTDPRVIEHSKPLMDVLRDRADESPNMVRIAQQSTIDPQEIMRRGYKSSRPGM